MKFQNARLPQGARKSGVTPVFSEHSIPEAILHRHLAPEDHCALLKVRKGSLQFVWLDADPQVLDADRTHPIVIAPGRPHRVKITGPVEFQIEFYRLPEGTAVPASAETLPRPGAAFLEQETPSCSGKSRELPQ